MVDFMLYCICGLSLAVASLALACIIAGKEYDAWVAEFNREGVKTALCPVLYGSEVVGYTVTGERRSRPR